MTVYRNRVNSSSADITVEIGVNDPTRWDGQGGVKFGYDVHVYASINWRDLGSDKPEWRVEVNMGSMSVDTEGARLKLDIYEQATEVAEYITDQLSAGISAETIGEFLTERLVSGKTTPRRFDLAQITALREVLT